MPAFKDRTGETRIMRCGMKATIIEYVNSHNITVQFEDGTVSEHRYYGDFEKGKIEHPNNRPDYTLRVGEQNEMNCGLIATIIEYRKSNDIDVQFEDGVVVKHRLYQDFLRGEITHPNLKTSEASLLGTTKEMHCGMNATIIAYRKSDDIDVCFEDGTIVFGCSLSAFKGQRILHPKFKIVRSLPVKQAAKEAQIYVGETRPMNCGMEATIIAYRGSKDIDVQFQNGEIATRKSLSNFRRGAISYPSSQEMINRIGEKNMMHCGMRATIIAYRSSKDIDIQFEDGTIIQNKMYGNFKTGRIEHPLIKPSASYPERVISGFLKAAGIPFSAEWSDPALRGQNKKKPLYFDFALIDDNKIVLLIEYQGMQHFKELERFGGKQALSRQQRYDKLKRTYAATNGIGLMEIPYDVYTFDEIVDFLNANLPRYGFLAQKYNLPVPKDTIDVVDLNIARIGESKEMQCGLSATIIAYRSSSDIDVKFDDGFTVCGVSYRRFCLGEVIPDNLKYKNQIANCRPGETKIMKCGMSATIIRYGSAFDIDVQFEDGTVRTRQNYSNFSAGQIGNLNIGNIRSKKKERIGLTKLMNCGMSATIIAYRKSSDLDVLFENGEIAEGKSFSGFQRGAIAYPSYMNTEQRLGESKLMNCGMIATIVEYRSSDDIDICFKDGTLLCNKTYDAFRKGEISNPTIYMSRLNEQKKMKCGMSAKIIAYRKSNDIDIQFDDGTVVQHRSYSDFVKAAISNPNLRRKK